MTENLTTTSAMVLPSDLIGTIYGVYSEYPSTRAKRSLAIRNPLRMPGCEHIHFLHEKTKKKKKKKRKRRKLSKKNENWAKLIKNEQNFNENVKKWTKQIKFWKSEKMKTKKMKIKKVEKLDVLKSVQKNYFFNFSSSKQSFYLLFLWFWLVFIEF